MASPVSAALTAYANASRAALSTGIGTGTGGATPDGGFGELLRKAASGAVDSLKQGEQTSLAAVAGKAGITEVAAALANAETTLQTVVAVRDRVISAYQDIIKMPI